jgi:hypothetical protein
LSRGKRRSAADRIDHRCAQRTLRGSSASRKPSPM